MSVTINQCCLPPTTSISTGADTTNPVPSNCGRQTESRPCSIVYQSSTPVSGTATEPDIWGLKIVIKGDGRTEKPTFVSKCSSSPSPSRWGTSQAVVRIATRMSKGRRRSPPSSGDDGEGCSTSDTASDLEGSYESDGCPGSDAASEAEIS